MFYAEPPLWTAACVGTLHFKLGLTVNVVLQYDGGATRFRVMWEVEQWQKTQPELLNHPKEASSSRQKSTLLENPLKEPLLLGRSGAST